MEKVSSTTSGAALTPEQISLCIEAQRAYYRASAALQTFTNAFELFNSYGDFGRLPKFDWERLTVALAEAQVAMVQFDGLIAHLAQQGIFRETAMLASNPQPVTPLDLAVEASRVAHRSVLELLVKKPTPAQRARSKAILDAASD